MKARVALVAAGAAAAVLVPPSAHATRPPSLQVVPAAVRAGEFLAFTAYCPVNNRPNGPVTSPGLTAPVPLTAHTGGEFTGVGTAGSRPGEFVATIRCPNWGPPVTTTFRIDAAR